MLLQTLTGFAVLLTTTFSQKLQFDGEICQGGSRPWYCKKLSECPSAQQEIRAGGRPSICSFEGKLPVVCCPPSPEESDSNWGVTTERIQRPTTTKKRPVRSGKAKQKCREYAKYVFEKELSPSLLPGDDEYDTVDKCSIVEQTLVLGGVNARADEFPHMALIGYGDRRISWLCGGSLISERFVLSAAHCTKPDNSGLAKWAKLGELNTASDRDGAKPITLKIIERHNHPDYDTIRLYNDIALYKLEKNVQFSSKIRPICLETENTVPTKAVATGWGKIAWNGPSSVILQKVVLNMVSVTRCNNSYSANIGRQLPRGIDDESMVCAGDELGKDTCQGDSGGPLQYQQKKPYCTYSQIGVTSFGKACGQQYPGVYTRVSNYVPWIEEIVWP